MHMKTHGYIYLKKKMKLHETLFSITHILCVCMFSCVCEYLCVLLSANVCAGIIIRKINALENSCNILQWK